MSDYSRAVRAYLDWYETLLSPLETANSEESAIEELRHLEARLNGLNQAAEELLNSTRHYVEGDDPDPDRTAAIDSLLHQVEGDLRVAFVTWALLQQHSGETPPSSLLPGILRQEHLAMGYQRLLLEMPAKFEFTAQRYRVPQQVYPHHADQSLEEALDTLRFEIDQTFNSLWERTFSTSLRLVRDILEQSEEQWELVLRGIDLLRGHQKVGDIGWGLEDDVDFEHIGLAAELRQTLTNVLECILSIIEKNDLVRYTIADWLEELKLQPRAGLPQTLDRLLHHLYQLERFRDHQLSIWLEGQTDIQQLQQAARSVRQLGNNFDRFSDQVRHLTLLLPTTKLFEHPLLRSTGYAIQVGLLGMLIFAGYDFIDEGSNALNLTRGVKEVLINDLQISPDRLREAARGAPSR